MLAQRSLDDPDLRPDVLLVAGGLRINETAADRRFVRGLRALVERSSEVGSAGVIGSGLVLASGIELVGAPWVLLSVAALRTRTIL